MVTRLTATLDCVLGSLAIHTGISVYIICQVLTSQPSLVLTGPLEFANHMRRKAAEKADTYTWQPYVSQEPKPPPTQASPFQPPEPNPQVAAQDFGDEAAGNHPPQPRITITIFCVLFKYLWHK